MSNGASEARFEAPLEQRTVEAATAASLRFLPEDKCRVRIDTFTSDIDDKTCLNAQASHCPDSLSSGSSGAAAEQQPPRHAFHYLNGPNNSLVARSLGRFSSLDGRRL